jgi:hypothetical protein
MNTFKRKALASAVLGTLGVAGSAHAIYQDPTNLGQVLVYPYYTVQSQGTNPYNTFISVTNTTTMVKVVKVRFREGKNSREVLDFNLYLSPNDMWTGAVIPSSTDVTSPARLITADVSCTNPTIPAGGIDFRNYEYTGAAADGLAAGLDRTREGYAEMFEMGQLAPGAAPGSAAVHGASGSPTCTGLTGSAVPAVGAAILPPTGGLFGTGTLIQVTSGRDTMYNANAFGQWRTAALYTDIGTDTPNFNDTSPATSIVVSQNTTGTLTAYFSSWSSTATAALTVSAGARAASATMMHSDVLNEYILDAATRSNTDWVLTFPTKRAFVNTGTAIAPFSNLLTTSGACETIDFTYFNREERTATSSSGDFSPLPPSAAPNSLCWESTVLSIRNGSTNAPSSPAAPSLVLGSQNVTSVALASSTTFQNGWASLHFSGPNASTVGLVSDGGNSITISTGAVVAGPQTFRGLPVVGFMVRTFDNGFLTCGTATCLGSYLGSVSHAYRNNITP